MGASIGTDDKGSKNIELNIIPFIDLMSCLTAFLLATAVWTSISQIDTSAAGKARDGIKEDVGEPELSVLIESDEIWVGVSRLEEFERIPRVERDHDWAQLERSLAAHKASSLFASTSTIQIAADSTRSAPVSYQALVHAMDVAKKSGFETVNLSDPLGLAARPQL
ncbi:MAG: biopolymer transporter ExbD [Kofleriaceae bacterium]|nr:biopolymer transporter ExbD [Kofleriaceae bacterium]